MNLYFADPASGHLFARAACCFAAIDTIGYQATAPGAAPGLAGTAITGDSLTIKNADLANPIWITGWWAKNQANGVHQLTWPSGNDQTRGIRSRVNAGFVYPRFARGYKIPIKSQELIATTIIGSAVGGQTEIGLIQSYYTDLPGVNAQLVSWPDVMSRGRRAVTIEDTSGALTSVQWSGSRAWNAANFLLQANTWYAVLGFNVGILCACVAVRGPDTGNLRVGCPGEPENADITEDWFKELSIRYDTPMIPLVNSANAGATFFDFLQDQAVTAVPFSVNLVEMGPSV